MCALEQNKKELGKLTEVKNDIYLEMSTKKSQIIKLITDEEQEVADSKGSELCSLAVILQSAFESKNLDDCTEEYAEFEEIYSSMSEEKKAGFKIMYDAVKAVFTKEKK